MGQAVLSGEQAVEETQAAVPTCLPNRFGHAVSVLHVLLTVHDAVVAVVLVKPVTEQPVVVMH